MAQLYPHDQRIANSFAQHSHLPQEWGSSVPVAAAVTAVCRTAHTRFAYLVAFRSSEVYYYHCSFCICSEDCVLGEWMLLGPCRKSCGGGQQFHTRKAVQKVKNGGELTCLHSFNKATPCNLQPCPGIAIVGSFSCAQTRMFFHPVILLVLQSIAKCLTGLTGRPARPRVEGVSKCKLGPCCRTLQMEVCSALI